ncbi:MAG: Gfo/Idh/MocA family oxidoreductase [Luteolibacter sp.]|nr:Gfo/Idh/MocA family oxidoreductase [Luteolibacter sp.]
MLAAGMAPMFIPARLLGAEAPSKLLRIGCIGTGRMGTGNMRSAIGLGKQCRSRIVAVCDANRNRSQIAKAMAESAGRELHGESAAEIRIHDDHRELLAREDIDGVIICTPDFSHAFIAMDAARAGKGIYLEKPLTHTIAEGQALVKTVRKHGVVLQTGSQQRSSTHFHRVCWLVRNGRIGTLKHIEVTNPPDHGFGRPDLMPVPENLDYLRWMGPTTDEPYAEDRVHPQDDPELKGRPGWLQIEKYCRGMITGWGAHTYDIAQWGLGTDFDSGPVEITAEAEFPDRGLFDVHTRYSGEAVYANGVIMKSGTGEDGAIRFIGSDGWLGVQRGKFSAGDPAILREQPEGGIELATSNNHIGNFLDCLRSGKDPIAPVEIGHRSNTVSVLHHIAMKLGRKIKWNPATEQITDDAAAAAMLGRVYRDGYSLPI